MLEKRNSILNACDDPDRRSSLTQWLREAGYEVRETSLAQALANSQRTASDVVLLTLSENRETIPDLSSCWRSNPRTRSVPILFLLPSPDRFPSPPGGTGPAWIEATLSAACNRHDLLSMIQLLLRVARAEQRPSVSRRSSGEPAPPHAIAEQSADGSRTGAAGGAASFRETMPEVFRKVAEKYAAMLDLSLEQQEFKVDHHLSRRMEALGESLAPLEVGPRDIIEIHSTALAWRTRSAPAGKAHAYVQEGRLMVLELMGHLASSYRKRSAGSRPDQPANAGASGHE